MSEFNVAHSPMAYAPTTKENPADSSAKSLDAALSIAQIAEVAQLEKQTSAEKESPSEKEPAASEQEIAETITEMNRFLDSMKRNISFSIDEELGSSVIVVKDSENDEVIRQLPSEELIVLRKKMDDVAGILFDTKV